jgi:thioredoxin 1
MLKCRLSIPVVKEVIKVFAGQIDVVEVCTDDLPEVASDSGVVSIPTIQMYYKSELMDTIVGCVAKTVLSSAVEKVLEDVVIRFGGKDGDADSDANRKAP